VGFGFHFLPSQRATPRLLVDDSSNKELLW